MPRLFVTAGRRPVELRRALLLVILGSTPAWASTLAQETEGYLGDTVSAESGCPPAKADTTRDRYFDSGGVCIRYRTAGDGPAVVLVHGFAANLELNEMNGLFPLLAEDFRAIALDNRGHGKSGKPHEPDAYGAEMAGDVVRLLDHLGIERAHVVGYSLGAVITVKLLQTAPERLRSAVLAGSGWRPPGSQPNELLRDWAEGLATVAAEGGSITDLLWHPSWPPPLPETRRAVDANDPRALLALLQGHGGLEVPETVIRNNRTPTLLVGGGEDAIFRPAIDGMTGIKPHLTVRVIPDRNHLSLLTDPALGRTIRGFLLSSGG